MSPSSQGRCHLLLLAKAAVVRCCCREVEVHVSGRKGFSKQVAPSRKHRPSGFSQLQHLVCLTNYWCAESGLHNLAIALLISVVSQSGFDLIGCIRVLNTLLLVSRLGQTHICPPGELILAITHKCSQLLSDPALLCQPPHPQVPTCLLVFPSRHPRRCPWPFPFPSLQPAHLTPAARLCTRQ